MQYSNLVRKEKGGFVYIIYKYIYSIFIKYNTLFKGISPSVKSTVHQGQHRVGVFIATHWCIFLLSSKLCSTFFKKIDNKSINTERPLGQTEIRYLQKIILKALFPSKFNIPFNYVSPFCLKYIQHTLCLSKKIVALPTGVDLVLTIMRRRWGNWF